MALNPLLPLQPLSRLSQARMRGTGGDPLLTPEQRMLQEELRAPLTAPEEESLLTQLGDRALGGLAWVGNTLDKYSGARAIRGVLGGKPQELLSLVPGSDMIGLSDPKNIVRGGDFLGLDPEGGFLQSTLPSIGLELLLDPLTYASFGGSALTKLGQQARKVGALPAKASARMRGLAAGTPELARLEQSAGAAAGSLAGKSLGGLVGWGMPFRSPATVTGTGAGAQRFADWVGKGVDKLKYGVLGRTGARLFDPNVFGLSSEAGQRASRGIGQETLQAGETAALKEQAQLFRELEGMGLADETAELRRASEGLSSNPQLNEYFARQRARLEEMKQADELLGYRVPQLYDEAGIPYYPRSWTPLDKEARGGRVSGFEGLPDSRGNLSARMDEFRHLPGGTEEGLNRLFTDPQVSGPDRLLKGQPGNLLPESDYIRRNYFGWTDGTAEELRRLKAARPNRQLPPDPVDGIRYPNPEYQRLEKLQREFKQSSQLARIVSNADPRRAAEGLRPFGHDPLADYTAYQLGHARRQAGGKALHEAIAESAKWIDEAGADAVPMSKVFEQAGLDPQSAGAYQLRQLVSKGKLTQGAELEELANLYVPADVANDLTRYVKGFKPEELNPVLKAWDSFTNMIKTGLTSIWPGFHSRNGLTGVFMNKVVGATDPRHGGFRGLLQPYIDADVLRRGEVLKDANKIARFSHLSPEEASRALLEEMFWTQSRVSRGATRSGEVIGRADYASGMAGQVPLPGRPGMAEPGFGAVLGDYLRLGRPKVRPSQATGRQRFFERFEEFVPWSVRGVGGRTEDAFSLARAGRELGHTVDDLNRMAAHIALARQGWDPLQAAARSKAAHYDYSSLTKFERDVMRRVFPFYNWMRHNTPFVLGELARKPSGVMGTAIRGTAKARQQQGFLPEYIGQGVALPIGGEGAEGMQHYLSQLGLPFEDVFRNLNFTATGGALGSVGTSFSNTLRNYLGDTNPAFKYPVEVATGRQLFSGRELHDLYGLSGVPELDNLLMNSPLSRAYTTGRTAMDERKSIPARLFNILGPGRINTVDMNKQRSVAGRNVLTEMLRANPNVRNFESLYVRPDQLGNLTATDMELMRLYRTLQDRARQSGRQAPTVVGF